mmetsp:Transcript_17030/g.51681  ORF Transcript_17030/g.51681 Transcript_17030/m.51681 type:complete len:267 (-) Transcript_17030:1011-1811(-)
MKHVREHALAGRERVLAIRERVLALGDLLLHRHLLRLRRRAFFRGHGADSGTAIASDHEAAAVVGERPQVDDVRGGSGLRRRRGHRRRRHRAGGIVAGHARDGIDGIDGRRGRAPVPQRADLVGLRPRARAWTGGRGRGGRVDGSRVGPLRPRAGRRLLSIRSGDAPDDASGPARTDAIIVGRQRVNVSDRRGPARRVDRRARGTRDALSRILPPAARRGARPSKGHRRADRAGAAAAARHSSSSRRTGRRPRGQGLVSAESEPQQ